LAEGRGTKKKDTAHVTVKGRRDQGLDATKDSMGVAVTCGVGSLEPPNDIGSVKFEVKEKGSHFALVGRVEWIKILEARRETSKGREVNPRMGAQQ